MNELDGDRVDGHGDRDDRDRWFQYELPDRSLAGTVECVWWAWATGEHRLVPDGCMDLLWFPTVSPRGAVWVCGPDTRSWSIDLPAGTPIAGVRFRPGAAAPCFRSPIDHLRDRRVRLEDLLGSGSERRLLDGLERVSSLGAKVDVLEGWVRRRTRDVQPDRMARAAAAMRTGEVGSVDALARTSGLSSRQLHRRFSAAVGYGPAFYVRVARLQRFMNLAATHPRAGLATLAVRSGYADQSHLTRDCRELADATPTVLRDDLRRTSAALPERRAAGHVRSVQDERAPDRPRWIA